MRRSEFNHVIAAAASIVDDELVVVGSQAVVAQFSDAPPPLLVSAEVDVYPRTHPERAEEIDGAMGDGSRFHETYGYYAHGVGPETVVAPAGWEARLVRVEVPALRRSAPTRVAWCLEVHDLLLAKLAAGRPHDLEFVREALAHRLVDLQSLESGIELMPARYQRRARDRLVFAAAGGRP